MNSELKKVAESCKSINELLKKHDELNTSCSSISTTGDDFIKETIINGIIDQSSQ